MKKSLTQPLTLKDFTEAILEKAQERNIELNSEFYSINAEEYEFIDINVFSAHKLLLFRCPKASLLFRLE